MKRIFSLIFVLSLAAFSAFAQSSTFTYQGQLTDGAIAASGTYEMQFSLWDDLGAGSQIGSTITNSSVSVVSGVFTVELDFGATAFPGAARWLSIAVRKASDPPGYTTLSPRQQITSSPYAIKTLSATSADGLSAECVNCVTDSQINDLNAAKLTGVVPIAKGGTGGTSSTLARNNLGLGTLATVSPTGTQDSTTFLRGDNTWAAFSGVTGTGTSNFVTKWTAASTVGNSLLRDDGTNMSVGSAPIPQSLLYAFRTQITSVGDSQATIYGYRTRDSQNDGTGYGNALTNQAIKGYNFWGDVYTFGVSGFNYNDYTRTGGVLGAEQAGVYWGSLGYKNSASATFGVYGSNAYGTGGGFNSTDKQGVGGGFFGNFIGSVSSGQVFGTVNSGPMFATYNLGNVFNSGYTADLVSLAPGFGNGNRAPAFAVTSPSLKVYDNGSAELDGDTVFIPFGSNYAGMLDGLPDVTVTPIGAPVQLYIKSIEANGFTVAAAGGSAKVRFSWIAVGNRVDGKNIAPVSSDITNSNFDTQLRDFLYDDSNKESSGKSLWWDGAKVRTDRAPQPQLAPKVEKPQQ